MKRWLVLAVAAIAIAGFSTVSFAAIQASHHDMTTYIGGASGDACYACHGMKNTDTTTVANAGAVGTLCYLRCHIGNGAAGDITTWASSKPEYGVYDNGANTVGPATYNSTILGKYTGGHKMVKASIPVPDAAADITALATWPYSGDANIQCTTCHDVHSNLYGPFLRAPLSTGTNSTSFCQQCHKANANGAARWVDITAAPNGSHPSEVDYSGAAARTNNSRLGRTILIKDTVAGDNNAVFRNVSAFAQANLNVVGAHYNPGGKLGVDYTTAYTPSTGGRVGCYTCHAVHQPMSDMTGQGLPQVEQLIVAPFKNMNTVATFAESDLCIGCHGGANDPGAPTVASVADNNCVANPGVTSYYHPVDGDSRPVAFSGTGAASTWKVSTAAAFEITVNLDNGGTQAAPLSSGPTPAGGRLLCASCHTTAVASATSTTASGVHAGPANTMLLNPRKPNCESCHNTTALITGLTPNSHHVYGGGATEGTRYTGYGYASTVTYSTGFTANISDGLQCNDCHTFNGTAHNWN